MRLILEVAVKLIIAFATGIGLGLATFGGTLMMHSEVDFDTFGRNGPPPADVFLAAGVALITAGLILTFLFIGPGSQRRWFSSGQETDGSGKPPMLGGGGKE